MGNPSTKSFVFALHLPMLGPIRGLKVRPDGQKTGKGLFLQKNSLWFSASFLLTTGFDEDSKAAISSPSMYSTRKGLEEWQMKGIR